MILAIIAGMFLDPLIPVLVPVILPTLLAFQIDLVHFGVLMVMAVVIGQLHPPIGIALIISGRIAGVDQVQVFQRQHPVFHRHHPVHAAADGGAGTQHMAAQLHEGLMSP